MSLASAADAPARAGEAISARTILALILVGVVAFAGFIVLAVYAPDLRARSNGGAHALSASAVGYRGATLMIRAMGAPVRVVRQRPRPRELSGAGLVLTPGEWTSADDIAKFPRGMRTLIVLPKWRTGRDPLRPGFVFRAGFLPQTGLAGRLFAKIEPGTSSVVLPGWRRPVLHGGEGPPFAPSTTLPLGRLDGLQTISGPGWRPVLVDEQGHMVMAVSRSHPSIAVLAEPDLLNNQGLTDFANARAGMAILQVVSGEDGLLFDVTLDGLGRQRSLGRLMLEPPWLAATLCVLAAAALMGWHAIVRFGAPVAEGRAIALGAAALVDNSAGLIRMARKEAALAPAYAQATFELVARAGGAPAAALGTEDADWLARTAARRGLEPPEALAAEAARAKSRDELSAVAEKLYRWRLEMTREDR